MADGGKMSGLHIPGFDTDFHGQVENRGGSRSTDLIPPRPQLIGPEGFQQPITMSEVEMAATFATSPIARRNVLLMAAFATGAVVSFTPRKARAADPDASSSADSSSSADGFTDASSSLNTPPNLNKDTLFIDVLLPGGANTDYFIGYRGDTIPTHVNGPLRSPPPTQPTAPANYLYVPDTTLGMGGNGLMHFLQFMQNIHLFVSDHQTQNHDIGKITALTGDSNGTVPSLPVQRAAVLTPNSPFSYVIGPGVGMVFTGGLPVGANSLDMSRLTALANPNSVGEGGNKEHIFPPGMVEFLANIRHDDIEKVLTGKYLPSMAKFAEGRKAAQNATQQVVDLLNLVKGVQQSKDQLFNSALMSMILFKQGIVGGASLQQNTSYDTHGDMFGTKDMQNYQNLAMSLYQIFTKSKELGVKVQVVLRSDFNRTPDGKSDHYKYGGTIPMGDGIKGARRVGVFNAAKDYVGEKITYADVQQWLLQNLGMDGMDLGVKTALANTTGKHAIQDMLDKQ